MSCDFACAAEASFASNGSLTHHSAAAPAMLKLSLRDLPAAYDGLAGMMTVAIDGIWIARRAEPSGPIAYTPSYRLNAGDFEMLQISR